MARKRRRTYSFMSQMPRSTNEANQLSNEASSPRSPSTNEPFIVREEPHIVREEPHIVREEPQQIHTSSASTLHISSGSNAPSTSDSTRKKGRGPAIGYQGSEKINVMFNDLMQPIGDSSTDFMNVLGGIARCGAHAPLNVVSWRLMPQTNLDIIWREIQVKTNVREEHKKTCMMKVGELWKKWKHRVKDDYYKPNKDNVEQLLIPPTDTRVSPNQWPLLVDYWKREEVQGKALRNATNRKQLEFPHRTGRTSHANIRAEMKANNEDTSRANVFIKTRSKKDGTIPDNDTRNIVERMNEKLNEVPIEEQTQAFKEQIFVDLMGSDGHGRVRTFGSGPSPRDIFGSRSSTSSSSEIEKIVNAKVVEKISDFEKNQMEMQKNQMEMLEKMEHMQHSKRYHLLHVQTQTAQDLVYDRVGSTLQWMT